MRSLAIAVVLATFFVMPASASAPGQALTNAETVMHGGGCRKSSPPGQCCHKETRTGTVHCH